MAGTSQAAGRGVIGGGASNPATSPGATVAGVEPGTPAASIGLAPGDTIVAVNGQATFWRANRAR